MEKKCRKVEKKRRYLERKRRKVEKKCIKLEKKHRKVEKKRRKVAGKRRKAEIKVPRNTDGRSRAGREVSTWEKTQSVNPQLRLPRARCASTENAVAKFIVPDWGVDSGIGLSHRPARQHIGWRASTITLCQSQLYHPVTDYEFGLS